ncbi:MAG TPA: ZIP family metal transporter [Rhizomicrobium sp.]|nr:ZIP family metal transporter [Rhizomicrobium sp.]
MTVILIACAAFAATMLGGIFAIRFRDRLHLILGFSAGAVVGVALFDLLPEAMQLGGKYYDPARLVLFIACGFLAYLVLDRLVLIHPHGHDGHHTHEHDHARGAFGATTLSVHSFLDGAAIGVGFQASPAVGAIVAAAVIAHDFSDGINTVGFILKNGGQWRSAMRWLFIDAVAPVFGAASTLLFRIPDSTVGVVLAIFAGCFLYLGATDLIPESQHRHPRAATTIMTLLGAATIYVTVRFWS